MLWIIIHYNCRRFISRALLLLFFLSCYNSLTNLRRHLREGMKGFIGKKFFWAGVANSSTVEQLYRCILVYTSISIFYLFYFIILYYIYNIYYTRWRN